MDGIINKEDTFVKQIGARALTNKEAGEVFSKYVELEIKNEGLSAMNFVDTLKQFPQYTKDQILDGIMRWSTYLAYTAQSINTSIYGGY